MCKFSIFVSRLVILFLVAPSSINFSLIFQSTCNSIVFVVSLCIISLISLIFDFVMSIISVSHFDFMLAVISFVESFSTALSAVMMLRSFSSFESTISICLAIFCDYSKKIISASCSLVLSILLFLITTALVRTSC